MELLESAIKMDPNNVWLYVHLAEARYDTGDTEGFELATKRAKEIHPFFEPLILMEARVLFENEEYDQSLAKIYELFEINPRYQPASSLFTTLMNRRKISNE